jgi:hypothetical protein
MDVYLIVQGVTEGGARALLKKNILSIDTIIPSLKTFHSDMRYFSIGVKILRKYIVGRDGNGSGSDKDLSRILLRRWAVPDTEVVEMPQFMPPNLPIGYRVQVLGF